MKKSKKFSGKLKKNMKGFGYYSVNGKQTTEIHLQRIGH